MATYEASGTESLTVTLGDGSFARLAQGSRMEEWAADGAREVSLEGKAFFAVSRNEERPFLVRTEGGRVRVLGTRFEVLQEGESLRVVVVEGRVAVSNEAGSVEVGAGEAAWIDGKEVPRAEAVQDLYAMLSWNDGFLVFQGTPLAQVAEEVARHYGRPLTVEENEVGQRRITAWFQGEPFEEVAQSLCLATGTVCTVVEDGIAIGTGLESGGVG
jgi:transmembrane sensor